MSDSRDSAASLPAPDSSLSRRTLLASLGALGVGTLAFQRSLAAQAEEAGKVTPAMIDQAAWVAGITLSEEERESVAGAVERDQRAFAALRKVAVTNAVPPAVHFFPRRQPRRLTAAASASRSRRRPSVRRRAKTSPFCPSRSCRPWCARGRFRRWN